MGCEPFRVEYVPEERGFRLSGTHLPRRVDGGEEPKAVGEALLSEALVADVRVRHGDDADTLLGNLPQQPFNVMVGAEVGGVPARA